MALNPTDIAVLSRLLDEAEAIAPVQREAWLSGLSADQAHLADLLRELLQERDHTNGPLATLPKLGDSDMAMARSGERVGPYRLLHEIGRGGMGSVWLSERADGSFERQVALKLPRLSWSEGLAERMARERRIAALLEHPAIARLYDAGLDERGRPYLAMEYIPGQAIDVWCRERKLDPVAKLKLSLQVIRAVAYAHGRLVIHRDLKPANILVDAEGQAHLLDFGIAKLMSTQAADGALTQETGRVLTPHYAAPEQIEGRPVGVAADVYALGVTLYELLTGQLPFAARRNTLGAIEEAILHGDAPPASSVAPDAATRRSLAGEVDAILHKAMQREPERRYLTADAFAQDIERHLQGETVSARPDTLAYRLRKALRRHWVSVSAVSAVMVAVLAGSAVTVVQARRAAEAAERERIVKEFVADVFRINAQPGDHGLRTIPGDAFLEQTARLVQGRFAGRPALQADLYAMVGSAFADMGASRLAVEYGLRRVEAMAASRADPGEQASAFLQLAAALLDQRRYEDAEQRALRAASLAPDDALLKLRAQVLVARSMAERDQLDQLALMLGMIDAAVPSVGDAAGVSAAWAKALRAKLILARNDSGGAIPLLQSAVDRALAVEGPGSGTVIELHLLAAWALANTSADTETKRHMDAALGALQRRGVEAHIRAAYERARFAAYRYRGPGRITAREALAEIALSRRELAATGRVLPVEMSASLDFFEADVLAFSGRVVEGMALAEPAFAILYPLAVGPWERSQLTHPFGRDLCYVGRHELADRWLRETLRLKIEAGLGMHPYTADNYIWVSMNLRAQGRLDEALAWLDSVPNFPPMREGYGLPDRRNLRLLAERSQVYLDRGDARRALEVFPRRLLDDPTDRGLVLDGWGRALCGSGRVTEGLAYLREALVLQDAEGEYEHAPWTAALRAETGRCALAAGQRQSAEALAAQARAAFAAQPGVSRDFRVPLAALERELAAKPSRSH